MAMLNCHIHDYVEIACLYKIQIRLKLQTDDVIEGVAQDVVLNDLRQECLLLEAGEREVLVVLTEIQSMQAIVENSHFDEVVFK